MKFKELGLGKCHPLTPGKLINLSIGEDSMSIKNVSSTHVITYIMSDVIHPTLRHVGRGNWSFFMVKRKLVEL